MMEANNMNANAMYLITCEQLQDLVRMTVREINGDKKKESNHLMSAREVGEKYGISPTSLWRWEKQGILHPKRVGNRRRYERAEIEKAIAK